MSVRQRIRQIMFWAAVIAALAFTVLQTWQAAAVCLLWAILIAIIEHVLFVENQVLKNAEQLDTEDEELPETSDDPHEMSFDEKLDSLKNEVRSYLRADDPEEWERREGWHWSEWEVGGFSMAEVEREIREKVPNLGDLPKEMQDQLEKKRKSVREQRRVIEEKQRLEEERQLAEQPKYIADWIARQTDDLLRQQFAEGLLSEGDAEKLIEAEALDHLLGPAYEYDLCYVSSRDRVFHRVQHGCGEWETHHLPPEVYSTWQVLRAKLPEGVDCSFYEVFPCLLRQKLVNPSDAVGKVVYVAKLTVPVGPFRFERNMLLSPRA